MPAEIAPTWREGPCFYVTVINGRRVGYLAGPFQTHQEALDTVKPAWDLALTMDEWAVFYAYGTARCETGRRTGVLNDKLGITV